MNRKRRILIFTFSLLLSIVAYFPHLFPEGQIESQLAQFNKTLELKEKLANNGLKKIKSLDRHQNLHQENKELHQQYENQDISYFIYHDKELQFWTEDHTLLEIEQLIKNSPVYESSGSWYKKISHQEGDSIYVALILLQKNFTIQNKFLKNSFQEDLQFPLIERLSKEKTDFPLIFSDKGKALLYATIDKNSENSSRDLMLTLLLFLGLLLVLYTLPRIIFSSKARIAVSTIFLAIILRLLLFFLPTKSLASIELFQSVYLALSSFFPSLGDLLLHLILLFILSYQLRILLYRIKSKILSFVFIGLSLVSAYLSIFLISNSIFSSQINFNLNNLFNLSGLSLVSLGCFCLFFLTVILIADTAIQLIKSAFPQKTAFGILSIFILLFIPMVFWWGELPLLTLWIVPTYFILWWYNVATVGKKIIPGIVILLISSATIAFWVNYQIEKKQDQQSRAILLKLAEERDPVAEFLFEEVQLKLKKDQVLIERLDNYWEKKDSIDQYLMDHYFNSYWRSYEINFSICDQNDSLFVSNWDASLGCINYFQNRLRLEGNTVSSNNLFQLQNLAGRIDYIGEIPLSTDTATYNLYVELSSNYFNANEGYPELLLNEKSKANSIDLSQLSYAVYNREKLFFHNGEYNYSITPKINELSPNSFYQYKTQDHHHTAYQKHENITIIISSKAFNLIDFFTAFAYLLVMISILFLSFSLLLKAFPFYFKPNFNDFSTKIQLFIIGSLLVALVMVAVGSAYYVQKQFQEKNISNLKEKLRSINLELEGKIGKEEVLSNNQNFESYLSSLLIRFSNVFYTDINFYDKDGVLYASSRPEVFQKGLKSERMHRIAFQQVVEKQKAEWVQNEKIGEMEYLSAYIPFVNYNNEVLGYINLPYFVKQGKLQEEISNFLVSIINIYVGIFALSLFISVILINQLSKPLLLIRKQIRKLKIGSSIELIDWNSQDEIGELVKEYNRIAIELNESAEQLAQSEREDAWREMAKQVAHEIKNPLTPMKLSIQHLQQAYEREEGVDKDRIKRTSRTLIEQIDTLSSIANAFSSFAKMPEKELVETNLLQALKASISLYEQEVDISYEQQFKGENPLILGDKDQLLRLFNNLIKNAVHAIERVEEGHIKIRLWESDTHFKVSISDNGIGIPEEQQERIFEPNFTTKSSGTGLGLAMCRNIINHLQAHISFESIKGKGTTFFLAFEKMKTNHS